ncbi:MAG: hypothetical protein JW852_03155 [Spirochaetales bacterium]|nr:hypothetical protein [Spirochaetales bacterium]
MKKILFLLFACILTISGVFAQDPADFEAVKDAFAAFADDLSSALPFASTIGLNWSDSYIGNFPHLGVALSAGAVGLPAEAFGKVLGTLTGGELGGDMLDFLPPELAEFGERFGLPFPAAALEARVGGLLLPFDIGLKVGFIPDEVDMGEILPAGMSATYELVGADVRLRLVEEKGLIPEIIVGGGVNRLTGGVSFSAGDSINVDGFEVQGFGTYRITLDDPTFGFDWETTVFDVKAQISKRLLIVTPYLGIGATMGKSKVSGGAYTNVNAYNEMDELIDATEWAEIQQALLLLGEDVPQLSETGFTITNSKSGFATRVYGGASLNLLFIKLDITGFYELLSQSLGLSAALRVQF